MTHVSNEQVFEALGGTIKTEKYPTGVRTSWVDKSGLLINPDAMDYTHDLQLVHDDLESRLTTDEMYAYVKQLEYIVAHENESTLWTNKFGDGVKLEVHPYFLINATAQQKCDAFVKVRGG